MRVLLIKDGVVDNVIHADSVERAAMFYPEHECVEQTESIGPGWRRIDGAWSPPPPPPPQPRRVTQFAFITRFTDAEAVAIDLASQGATVEAASMRRYMAKVNAATYIDLDDPATRGGVQALEAVGLIGPGRAAQILDNPVTAQEQFAGGA